MKLLLNIALGKSVYTVYFMLAMAASIMSAVYLESILAINVALVFVSIFGVFIIISALFSTNEAIESLSWPKVNAELGVCKVSTHSVGNIGSESYYPTIQYSFDVDGKTYHGNNYSWGERTYSRSIVEKIINNIQSNKDNFRISYNPNNPTMSVLRPGINEVHYVRALVGLAVFIFAICELFNWTNYI